MSWMEQLVQTYDENERFAGGDNVDGVKVALSPIGYSIHDAWLEVVLGENGDFIHAFELPKEERATSMPCTPYPRTSGPMPHPLFDIHLVKIGSLMGHIKSFSQSGCSKKILH